MWFLLASRFRFLETAKLFNRADGNSLRASRREEKIHHFPSAESEPEEFVVDRPVLANLQTEPGRCELGLHK